MWPVHLWFCGKSFSFLFGENLVVWIHHNIISNIFWGVLWTSLRPNSTVLPQALGIQSRPPHPRGLFLGGNLAVLESSFQAKRPESGRILVINGHSCKQCRSMPSRSGVLLPQPWSANVLMCFFSLQYSVVPNVWGELFQSLGFLIFDPWSDGKTAVVKICGAICGSGNKVAKARCQHSSLLGIVTALASFCLPLLNAYHKSSQLTSNSANIPPAGCDKAGWSVRPHVLVLYEQLLEQGESKCDWYGFVNGGYPQMAIFQYGKWGFKPNLGPYVQTSLASLEDGRWQAHGLNVSMAMIQRNCLVDIHIAYHQVPQKIATGSSPQKERR